MKHLMVCVQIAWVKAFDFLTKKRRDVLAVSYLAWLALCISLYFIDFCIVYDEIQTCKTFDRSPKLIWHRRSFNDSI